MSEKKGLFASLFGGSKSGGCCNMEIVEEPKKKGGCCDMQIVEDVHLMLNHMMMFKNGV